MTRLMVIPGVAGDAMSGLVEEPKRLDDQVQQVSWSISFMAAYRLWRCEPAGAAQTPAPESMGNGGARQREKT